MKIPRSSDMDPQMRAIIDGAHGAHEPSELARLRVRRGIEGKLMAGLVGVAVVPVATSMAVAAKVTLAIVAVGTVVAAGLYALPARAPVPRPIREVTMSTTPRPPAPPPAVLAPVKTVVLAPAATRPPVRRRPVTVASSPPAFAPTENGASLKEETALLGAARTALGHGDLARARTLLGEYDRRPGLGALAEERSVTGILVSCAAGHVGAARVESMRFRARWPRSPLGARVDDSCVGVARPTSSRTP